MDVPQSGHPFLEVVGSVQQVLQAFGQLARASFTALLALVRFLWIWLEFVSPCLFGLLKATWIRLSQIGASLSARFLAFSWQKQVLVVSVLATGSVCLYLWRIGVLRRASKKISRVCRHSKRTALAIFNKCEQITVATVRFVREAVVVMLPSITVILPLKLYVSDVVFRRLFNMTTFAIPLWYSLTAILPFSTETPDPPEDSTIPVANRRKSLFVSAPEIAKPVQKRKTTVGVADRYNPDDEASHETALAAPLAITVWLDYWVIAAVFDLLMNIPLLVARLIFGTQKVSIASIMFGAIHYSPWVQNSINFSPLSARIPSSSWLSASETAFSIIYDLAYSMLLMFVISHKHRYLVLTRHLLVGIIDFCFVAIIGVHLTPSRRLENRQFRSHQAKGLLPMAWDMLKGNAPPTILLGLDLLAHVPQILLLMLPSFLLPAAVFGISLVYPLLGSLRSLESSNHQRQTYWLSYFAMKTIYESLLMKWVRASRVWSFLPLTAHLELLLITALQVLCLTSWLSKLFPREAKKEGKAPLQAEVIIKEEIEDDDEYRPVAYSDPVRRSRRNSYSETSQPSERVHTGRREPASRTSSRDSSAVARKSFVPAPPMSEGRKSEGRESEDGRKVSPVREKRLRRRSRHKN